MSAKFISYLADKFIFGNGTKYSFLVNKKINLSYLLIRLCYLSNLQTLWCI